MVLGTVRAGSDCVEARSLLKREGYVSALMCLSGEMVHRCAALAVWFGEEQMGAR